MKISLRPSTDYVKNYSKEAAAHDYFSLFNQSNHWFVALSLSLPSSFRKLPIKKTLTLYDVEWILKIVYNIYSHINDYYGLHNFIRLLWSDLVDLTKAREEHFKTLYTQTGKKRSISTDGRAHRIRQFVWLTQEWPLSLARPRVEKSRSSS